MFTFGAVLYEMVTGRRRSRATPSSRRCRRFSGTSRERSQIVRDVPSELERVVARCLRKDAARRFQHMADVKVALEELKEESESAQASDGVAGAA